MQKAAELILQRLPSVSAHGSEALTQEQYEQKKADAYNASTGHLNEQDGYNCDLCKNKGYIACVDYCEQFNYYAETLKQCKCMRARNAIRRLNKSGLKDVMKKWTFDSYQTPDAWQQTVKAAAMRFCRDEEHRWFFMGGQSGAGKSHLCTAIAVDYLRHGSDVRYMVWRDEIQRIKACANDEEEYGRLMNSLKTATVLYIDDLFKIGNKDGRPQMPTPADINVAFELINYRYINPGLTTIISSERTLSELLEIDEATAGRIAECTKLGGYCINLKKDASRNWRMRGLDEI